MKHRLNVTKQIFCNIFRAREDKVLRAGDRAHLISETIEILKKENLSEGNFMFTLKAEDIPPFPTQLVPIARDLLVNKRDYFRNFRGIKARGHCPANNIVFSPFSSAELHDS